MKIQLIDGYAQEPAKLVRDLENLDELLSEREAEVFRCTCDDDPENPRGVMEYDTNAYIHADDCPSGSGYHYHVLLAGLARYFRVERPTIVCLCGSTRFWREFQRAGLAETMAGRIVLSIGAASGTDDEHFGNLPRAEYDRVKAMLDTLHMRKIDLTDEVLILNVDGYVGESTRRELEYARSLGKTIRWLEPDKALVQL